MSTPILEDYIGDGVYVESDNYGGIWIKANHHEHPTDKVYLEPSVFEALLRFRERVNHGRKEKKDD